MIFNWRLTNVLLTNPSAIGIDGVNQNSHSSNANFDVEICTNANSNANVTKIKTLHAINICTHHVIFKNNRNMTKIIHIHYSDL